MAAAAVLAAAADSGESSRFEETWREDVRRRALQRRTHEPGRPGGVRRIAWIAALALHLLLIVVLRIALRRLDGGAPAIEVMRVDLIDAPVAEPALPSPAPLPRPAPLAPTVQRHPEVPAERNADRRDEAQPRLFNPDGTVALPPDIDAQIARARRPPDFVPRRYDPSPLLLTRRPLKVRPNHFAAAWAGTDGKPLSQTIWEPLTFVAEFRAPWGGRYACGWILILVACGDIPDKPWNPPQTWRPASVLDEQ